jgi:hypothetical protein
MKGDFTRVTFDQKKHYTGVLKQQGRVDLDADWNEYVAIQDHLDQTETQDVVGPCGVPKSGGGFEISAGSGGLVNISRGHIYVDGILCEAEKAITYPLQPDYRPTPAITAEDGRTELFYLDVWQRHVTAIEDPEIREKALGGPDTTTRVKTVWQVKTLKGEAGTSYTCQDPFPGWDEITAGSTPYLSTRGSITQSTQSPDDLCLIAAGEGYRGLENRLYRVEIHQGGSVGSDPKPTFKWSRDNGSVAFAIKAFDKDNPKKITVEQLGRDQVLALHEDDWVEVLGDETEWDDKRAGTLAQIAGIDRATLELTLDRDVSAHKDEKHPKVRRWDQRESSTVTLEDGAVPVQEGTWIDLEQGVQIHLEPGGTYRPGDYWVFAARAATGSTPRGEVEELDESPPRGIAHHYCKLALVTWKKDGQQWKSTIQDCRPKFPPLANICAEDVCYDSSNTPELGDVSDVQAAIEALYLYQKDGCSLVLLPGYGWEKVLDRLGDGQDANLCFQAGEYPLRERVTLRNKGHVKITGFGPGTHIVAQNDEAALVFENCRSVTIRDLYAEARRASSPAAEVRGVGGLMGVLTFCDCGALHLDSVALKCGSAAERAAACISAFNTGADNRLSDAGAASIRIHHCDLRVGHQQVGILLINAMRARIEDNMLRVSKRPKSLTLERLLQNKQYRATVRNLLIHDVQLNPSLTRLAPDQVLVRVNRQSVLFETDRTLVNDWNKLLEAHTPWGVQSHRQLYWHLRKIAATILLNTGTYPGSSVSLPAFAAWYRRLSSSNMAAAAQGIVVGGTVGRDIQIHRNTIFGAHQGIHLGLSNPPYAKTTPPSKLGTVVVADNNIGVFLSPAADERHGIFVGNCDSLIVKDNYVQVRRFPVTQFLPVDGIRVYGFLGWMMIVGQNHLVNCTTGIRVQPLGSTAQAHQWLVADNAMPGAAQAVIAPASVLKRGNVW